jgi:hypothetical protein
MVQRYTHLSVTHLAERVKSNTGSTADRCNLAVVAPQNEKMA